MTRFLRSRFKLTKRYARYSNYEVYFQHNLKKKVRYGYKVYQKIFRRYKSKKTLRINVRKPRIAVKRKTAYGKALEMKNKYSCLIGGIHASKLSRFVRLNYSKIFSSARTLTANLESRLDVLVAKISLLSRNWIPKRFVKFGYVDVDGKPKTNVGFVVKKNSKVSLKLKPHMLAESLIFFKQKSAARVLFWPFISGFEISKKTFKLIKYAEPHFSEVKYPFNYSISYFYRLYPR